MIDETIKSLRKECKKLGVKLKTETLSWGRHCTFIFTGPNGEEHKVGNIAPVWWTDEHVKTLQALDVIRTQHWEQVKDSKEGKLYGLKP